MRSRNLSGDTGVAAVAGAGEAARVWLLGVTCGDCFVCGTVLVLRASSRAFEERVGAAYLGVTPWLHVPKLSTEVILRCWKDGNLAEMLYNCAEAG